jgi:hypothetical protein
MHVNAVQMEFVMQEAKESMSVADRVASLVVAAALVVAIGVIAVVGPNTALSAASVATSRNPFEIHHIAPESRSSFSAAPRVAERCNCAADRDVPKGYGASLGASSSVNASSATGRLMR